MLILQALLCLFSLACLGCSIFIFVDFLKSSKKSKKNNDWRSK